MDLVEIARVTEQAVRERLGPEFAERVSVTVEPSDDGSEWLDIRAHSRDHRLPTARQSLDFKSELDRKLASLGETRDPNMIFVTAAAAA